MFGEDIGPGEPLDLKPLLLDLLALLAHHFALARVEAGEKVVEAAVVVVKPVVLHAATMEQARVFKPAQVLIIGEENMPAGGVYLPCKIQRLINQFLFV